MAINGDFHMFVRARRTHQCVPYRPLSRADDMRCGWDIFVLPIDLQPTADMILHTVTENNTLIKSNTKVAYVRVCSLCKNGFLVYNTTSHTLRIHAHRKSFSAWIIMPSARNSASMVASLRIPGRHQSLKWKRWYQYWYPAILAAGTSHPTRRKRRTEKGWGLGGTIKSTKHSQRYFCWTVNCSKSKVHDRVYPPSKSTANKDTSCCSLSYDGKRCRQQCLSWNQRTKKEQTDSASWSLRLMWRCWGYQLLTMRFFEKKTHYHPWHTPYSSSSFQLVSSVVV